jgi:hypothetical protein
MWTIDISVIFMIGMPKWHDEIGIGQSLHLGGVAEP